MLLFNLKIVLEQFMNHGRRAILRSACTDFEVGQTFCKLSKKQSKLGCERPPSSSLPSNVSSDSISLSIRSRGNFLKFLRPLVRNVLQVTSPIWSEARRRSTKRLFGETAPYFALVGVTLVSCPERGLLTDNDELEVTCSNIREAIHRAGWIHNPQFWKEQNESDFSATFESKISLDNFDIGSPISKGCSAAIYEAKWKGTTCNYPLAIKMMFNYEAESNAPAILSSMHKELLPAKSVQLDGVFGPWKQRFESQATRLLPHVNIVNMPYVFVDRVPLLSDGFSLYPDALPRRINPSGFGRNMSLFCVMKRYDCTLKDYLRDNKPTGQTSLFILTQILEAVNHMLKQDVVHRDLKSDNILLCVSSGLNSPHLVIADFGCCLAAAKTSVTFSSYDADPRAGNAALMAPEIKSASPGMFSWLNYSKADLWTVGTLAYEIFGMPNPFVSLHRNSKDIKIFDSTSYKESQLPKLPKSVPVEIRSLVADLLKRNPNQRPSAAVAANLCQLSLWAPRKWLNKHSLRLPSKHEVTQWLLCLATKVLCEAGYERSSGNSGEDGQEASSGPKISGSEPVGRARSLEYEIVSTFLQRADLDDIFETLKWIRRF